MGFSLKGLVKGALGGGLLGGPIGGQFGGLLGSGGLGGGGGDGNTTTTSITEPNKYVAPYLSNYLQRAQDVSRTPYEAYGGNRIAGFNPDQENAFGMIRDRATAGSPYQATAGQTLESTARGDYLNPESNPYLQGTINKALGDVRGSLGSTFSGQNFGGSAHEEMLNRRSMEAIAPILMGNYQQERGNQLNASLAAPEFAKSDYNDYNTLLGLGSMQQGQTQNEATAKYEDWLRQQSDPSAKLGLLGGAVQTGMGAGGTTTATGPDPNKRNTLADIVGTVAGGAGLYKMLASDIRLKRNIQRIGTHVLGIGIYLFEYIWGEWSVGVMAQEVLSVKPDAVHLHPSGFMLVDFGNLGV